MTVVDRHGLALRLIHWLTASLVVVQFTLAVLNRLFYEPRPVLAEWLVQTHMSLGAAVFLLTLGRLALRPFWPGQVVPPMSNGLPTLARGVHLLLYACLLFLPIFGYIRLAALGFEPSVFGLVTLPAWPVTIDVARVAAIAHAALSVALLLLVIAHAAGALLHQRLFGPNALSRMAI